VNERPDIVENIGFNVRDSVDLVPSIDKITQEDRDIVIGIRPRIAAHARTEKHDAFDTVAVKRIERSAKTDQDGICLRVHDVNYIMNRRPSDKKSGPVTKQKGDPGKPDPPS